MAIINVLCIATEKESTECTELYIKFKTNLQTKSTEGFTIKFHDVSSVQQTPQRGSNKLVDKLEKKMDSSTVILVICSPALKSYLDDNTPSTSDLLKKDERKVLLKALGKHKQKKVILVYLDETFSTYIPLVLQGVDQLDGINDMSTLVEVKIPAKL